MSPAGVQTRRQNDARQEALARTNPAFGPRRLKLGTFCTNVSGGACMSTMEGVLRATWPDVMATARLADEMRFEAIVPLGRWQGFGGVTRHNGESFEAMTFCALVTAQTQNPSVFATIDHAGGGRFTLNVVCGWNQPEIELFGSPLLEHSERYAMAEEWITLLKRLWTEEAPFDHAGKHFRLSHACLKPRPIQPYPALMSASGSAIGKAFAARHFDIVFAGVSSSDPPSVREKLVGYRNYAHQEFGRDLKVWTTAYVIVGDTEADARRQFERCVHEKGDRVAAENFMAGMGANTRSLPPDLIRRIGDDMIAGYGSFALVGTAQQVADGLQMLADNGADGVLLTWPAFIDGMERFKADVLPLLCQAGLR